MIKTSPINGKFAVFVGGVILFGIVGCTFESKEVLNFQEIERQAVGVCKGQTIPAAKAYSAGPGLHTVFTVDDDNTSYIRFEDYPSGWLPENIEGLELVACIDSNNIEVGSCRYMGMGKDGLGIFTLHRRQNILEVNIYSANDGSIVDSTFIRGPEPRHCETEEAFEWDSNDDTVYGESVSIGELINNLTKYANQ